MKKNPTQFPCTAAAEAMIIGRHEYSGYGMYVKLLQIMYKLPDRCLPHDQVQHIVSSNGMDLFVIEQLLENPALFISSGARYFVVEAKAANKKTATPPQEAITPEHPLQQYIKKWFPIVSSMDIQMSVKNCEDLLEKYQNTLIVEKLKAMENKKGLTKTYTNVYLTLGNWCRMEMERGWAPSVKATAVTAGR